MKALNIYKLSKIYQNGLQALNSISLDIEHGDFFALLGPNGAGKSTTIGIIASLISKTKGKVLVFDSDIDTDNDKAKSHIGLVPQEFNFNDFEQVKHILVTQAGYYGIGTSHAEIRADELLDQLGLWHKRHGAAGALSGGMKRRLMIARALIHSPKLLILDEPTAGVDIELRRSMWDFLREINKNGTTIILTTHYLEEAENLCRRIAIIDKGNIIEHTDMKSLLNRLEKETFILDLKHPLPSNINLNNIIFNIIDNITIEIELDRTDSLNDIFKLLITKNIEVRSMRNKANRLEELFLNIIESTEMRL